MGSIQRGHENATELRLDYEDLGAGELVIVIRGLPNTDYDSFALDADGLRVASATGSNGSGRQGPPPSALIEVAEAINGAIGYRPDLYTSLVLAAWRGQEARALELIAATIQDATEEDGGRAAALAEYATALLHNGLCRYECAVAAAQRACADENRGPFAWALAELVEASARSGNLDLAAATLKRIEARTSVCASEWALGIQAQSRALLAEREEADVRFQEALVRFGNIRADLPLARAQLLYGECLRRDNRRVDARDQLRPAYEMFSRIGANGFAERARRELVATGETVRKRTVETRADLTPQEAQIARLARDGLSNPEIGAQLFISPRTVQYHLRKVFQKLDITSRNQLGRLPASRLSSA
jgi:DNA-binding CsgD family transcriptional regulator